MELDDVRALKRELSEGLAATGLVSRAAARGDIPARRMADLGRPRRDLAMGIAPDPAVGFRLAVRVQDPAVPAERLEALSDRARGEVDVRVVGRVTARQAPRDERRRPLVLGCSIGHVDVTAGTLGAVVARPGEAGTLLLSNNHVLADQGRARIGDLVVQPGRADGGRPDRDVVGALDAYVALQPGASNLVDCAVALLDDDVAADPVTLEGLGTLGGTVAAVEVERVAKLGRTTGLTEGRITAFEVDGLVVDFDLGPLRFDGQVEVSGTGAEPFSAGGDSGSLIVDAVGLRAVGLLFAGGERGASDVTYANPVDEVLGRLGVELVR